MPHSVVLTPEQLQQLRRELQEKLGEAQAGSVTDDATLQRFFRATGGHYAHTVKRLAHTAAWRHSHLPERIDCSACKADPTSHYMHIVGHDKLGRPVLYSTFVLMGNRSVKPLVDHMVQCFETAVRLMPPGVEQWVWLNDFIGFGFADMNPALALSFIELSASHYPERLGQLLVLDAPSIMTPVWNMVKPFVDAVTHKKIRFMPNDLHLRSKPGKVSHMHTALQELLGDELLQWVVDEMAAVRAFAKKKGPRPRYDLSELQSCIQDGRLPPLAPEPALKDAAAARVGGAASVGGRESAEQTHTHAGCGGAGAVCGGGQRHSHYGCPTMLQQWVERAEALHAAAVAP